MSVIAERLSGQLIPAVPVPFRGSVMDHVAQSAYADRLAMEPIGGVAVWAHTGRGRYLDLPTRSSVLRTWRTALPGRIVVAGAHDEASAALALELGADALLIHPVSGDTVAHHRRLSANLPSLAFWLYEGAGGVSYSDETLDAILELPNIIGIKVATLDSVITFQHIATVMTKHPGKLLITGEDRFLGYSLMMGANAALIGMGAAATRMQCDLLGAWRRADWTTFFRLSNLCDRFAAITFADPVEGYVRRMLWAAAAEGLLPYEACDDPWGPPLGDAERDGVIDATRRLRAATV